MTRRPPAPTSRRAPAGPAAPGVRLSGHTTLRLGGPAARFVEAGTEAAAVAAVAAADAAGEPVLILGGGSNLVIADAGFPGTVVRIATRGLVAGAPPASLATAPPDQPPDPAPDLAPDLAPADLAGLAPTGEPPRVVVTVQAGEEWEPFVAGCVAAGLAGVECLSGIPGLVGATPIQNVGAYGQEVADVVVAVRAYDRRRRRTVVLDRPACRFDYRTSVFKGSDRYVVLAVTFALEHSARSGPIRYAELARALGVAPGDRVGLGAARDAVLALRAAKGMVLDPADPDTVSAGSFFTNPVLTAAEFAELRRRVAARLGPGVEPAGHTAPDGLTKVSAAWLIERAGFGRGHSRGRARISTKHTLALTNPGGAASTAEVLALAREVRDGVREAFGVTLVNEPVLIGASL